MRTASSRTYAAIPESYDAVRSRGLEKLEVLSSNSSLNLGGNELQAGDGAYGGGGVHENIADSRRPARNE